MVVLASLYVDLNYVRVILNTSLYIWWVKNHVKVV